MTEGRNNDPRLDRSDDVFFGAEQPVVGPPVRGASVYLIVAGFAIAAIILFFVLNSRQNKQATSLSASGENASSATPAPPPPLEVPVAAPAPSVTSLPPPLMPVASISPPAAIAADNDVQRLHAPAMVVDLQSVNGAGAPVAAPTAAGTVGSAAASPAVGAKPDTGLLKPSAAQGDASALLSGGASLPGSGANEQFAARVSNGAPEPAIATQLTGLGTTITQGATIPGVLETALNSDLPGYTRAVVSRDVRSFDGNAVLIPRGSRLIGQYRSALSLGQSRVFVIWTRVIRPDGVSIEIGSPGDDNLGRSGLSGDVNTHFFARFGSSILLSVLNGGIAAIAGTPTTQISIGSPAAAVGAAATATVPTGGSDIMPTVTVKQGIPINIFVARDLDFSAVKPFQ